MKMLSGRKKRGISSAWTPKVGMKVKRPDGVVDTITGIVPAGHNPAKPHETMFMSLASTKDTFYKYQLKPA